MCSCIDSVDRVLWNLRRWGEFSRFFLCLTGMPTTCRYASPSQEVPPVLISVVMYNSPLVPALLGATLRPHVLANVPPTLSAEAPWRWLFPRTQAIIGSGLLDLGEQGWDRLANVHDRGIDLAFLVTAGHPEPSVTRLLHAATKVGALLRPVFVEGLPAGWPKGERVPSLRPLHVWVGAPRPVSGENAWGLDELLTALQEPPPLALPAEEEVLADKAAIGVVRPDDVSAECALPEGQESNIEHAPVPSGQDPSPEIPAPEKLEKSE